MTNYLEFEKPLAEIEGKAEELRALARQNEEMDVDAEAEALDKRPLIFWRIFIRRSRRGGNVR